MGDHSVPEKLVAWERARDMVAPIVEQHGIEESKIGGALFVSPTTLTKVDQHLSHIMNVADWLMNGGPPYVD